MPLEKPPRYQGPVQLIERLVVAYSPHSDWNGAFAQDLDMSHLIKTASDEGMEVVLFNVDKALKPAQDWDQREQMFLNKLTKTGRDKNSILIISTHGGTATSNDQSDTTLKLTPHQEIAYSKIAERIDDLPTVKGVVLGACHGFCDYLQKTGTKTNGRFVAAASADNKEGTAGTAGVIFSALSLAIMTKHVVPLGPELEKNIISELNKPFGAFCKASEKWAKDRKSRMTVSCKDGTTRYTFAQSMGDQMYGLGGDRRLPMTDADGNAVKLCQTLDERQRFGIPDIRYSLRFVTQETQLDPIGKFTSLRCRPDGTWAAERPGIWADNDAYRDPFCIGRGERIPISKCPKCSGFVSSWNWLKEHKVDMSAFDTEYVCKKPKGVFSPILKDIPSPAAEALEQLNRKEHDAPEAQK